jgi:hypothetical protein
MGLKNYKKSEVIEVVYQAAGATTGIVVTMDVYDETGSKDVAKSGAMTEIGVTGRYKKAFTPDEEGGWVVLIADANGGRSAGSFSVGTHNIESLGAIVASSDGKVDTANIKLTSVDGKVDTMDGKVVTVDSKVVTLDGKVVSVDGKITTLDGKVVTLDGKVDTLTTKVNTIMAPPMIG